MPGRKKERSYVHDIANRIIVCEAGAKRTIKMLKEKGFEEESDEVVRLEKVLRSSKEIVEIIKEFRQHLIDTENE